MIQYSHDEMEYCLVTLEVDSPGIRRGGCAVKSEGPVAQIEFLLPVVKGME